MTYGEIWIVKVLNALCNGGPLLFLGSDDAPLAPRRSLPDLVGIAPARPAEAGPIELGTHDNHGNCDL